MLMTEWEETVVDLFSEVSILEPLINQRIEAERPEGFGEVAMAILITLSRLGEVGTTRGNLIWELEDTSEGTSDEIDTLIARGHISAEGGALADQQLTISAQGRATMAAAVRALMPRFKPALEGISIEAMVQAAETLREIRRTLDNLPD